MSAPDNPGDEPLRVCYILKMFPRLSETFILNEILELEERGVDVSVVSLMLPHDGRFHGRLGGLKLTVDHVVRDKPEGYWARIRGDLVDYAPALDRWQPAIELLEAHAIPKDFDLLLRAVVIAGMLQKRGVHHVHAHFATIATRVAALVSSMTGITFSFTSHAKDIFRETVDRNLYRDLVDRSAFNVTVSDYNREFLIEHTPNIDAAKVRRLYNGIDLGYFQPSSTPRDPNHVLSVGRLVPKKGFDVLLRAAKRLVNEGSRLRFTIVGDGEDRDALHALNRELGLENTVTFAGGLPQERVRELYDVASITALACVPDAIGNRDALPTTLLESLACGVPAVSTRLTGVPEIIDETVGAVVEPNQDEPLARAIAELAQRVDPALRQRCRDRAADRFDLRRNVATLHEFFEEASRSAKNNGATS